MMKLSDKTILITGAASGLGKEIAKQLANTGAKLILTDKEEIAKVKGYTSIKVDISDVDSVKQMFHKLQNDNIQIDILINNAGIWTDTDIEKSNPGRRAEVLQSNTLGMINVTEELIPSFKDENRGIILNIVSVAATHMFDNLKNWRTYGASKWGANGYTKALRDTFSDGKTKVIAVYPGGFESNLYENAGWADENAHNQLWMMRAEDVAKSVIFALSQPDDVEISEIVVTKKVVGE